MKYYHSKGSGDLHSRWQAIKTDVEQLSSFVKGPMQISTEDLDFWSVQAEVTAARLQKLIKETYGFISTQRLSDEPPKASAA